jgi:hypothetical protein
MWAMIACSIWLVIWVVWLSYMDKKQAKRSAIEGYDASGAAMQAKSGLDEGKETA